MSRLMQIAKHLETKNIRRSPSMNNKVTQDPACATCYYSQCMWSEQSGQWLVCTADPGQDPDECDAYLREPGSDDEPSEGLRQMLIEGQLRMSGRRK